MFYFFHATDFENFKNILKTKYIYASFYLPQKTTRIGGQSVSKFVFTNIYVDGLPLHKDEKAGIGPITFIIDPLILQYKTCYFNPESWYGDIYEKTIIMNYNISLVLDLVKINYRYPLILSHEALFKKRISMKFVIGIICKPELIPTVRKYLDKYGYDNIQIFNHFPTLFT